MAAAGRAAMEGGITVLSFDDPDVGVIFVGAHKAVSHPSRRTVTSLTPTQTPTLRRFQSHGNMSSRRLLLSLLRNARLAPAGRLAAAPSSRSFHLPAATAGAASSSGSNDGNFSYSLSRQLGSTFGAILIGQTAVFLGLSNNSVFAQDDSVAPAASSEQADANVTNLRRIEDGSVISNEHTIKWRIFTDNARDFLLKGKLDKAEKFFKAALHEAKEGFGRQDPHATSALNNLADFYTLRKEYEKAEPLYLEAIEILEQSFGPDDIRVGTALRNLGQCYHIQRKFDQAQTCYERALKIEGRVIGVGHPDYGATMYLLVQVLSLQRKGKDAEALVRESIRMLEEAGLGESPACIQRMRFLSALEGLCGGGGRGGED